MVQLTRPTPDLATAVPRDTTVAAIWRDLNRVGLRVAAAAGFGAAVAYLALLLITRSPEFGVSAALGAVIGFTGLYGSHRPDTDMEVVLLTAAVAAVSAATLTSPVVRGGLWAAIAVITTIGALILPDRKQNRFLTFISLLLVGQLLWPLLGYSTLVDSLANVVVSVTCTAAGVAIVRIAKSALNRSEQTRIKMFRSVPVGLFRCAPSGTIIDANPALANMLGHSDPSDLIGQQIAELHEDANDWASLVDHLQNGLEPRRFAYRMKHHNGDPMWVRGFAQAIHAEASDEIIYLEGAIEDVTQRREAEEVARLNADRFRNVFERAPIAIWEEDYAAVGTRLDELRRSGIIDIRGYLDAHPAEVHDLIEMIKFLDVNPAGIALVGATSKADALGGLAALDMPADVKAGFVEEFTAIWEDRDSMTIEIRGTTLDGRGTDLALSWAVGRTTDGSLDLSRVVVAIQDIAIIRQAERDLAALVESKDDLVASVSHELRTPITTILGMAFELRDHSEAFTVEESGELISIIADQSRELSNIVEDLLVAAWTDSDTLAVRPEVVNITTEIRQIVASEPGGPEVDIDRPVLAWADPLRFRQILRNLLSNAGKYGGPKVRITAQSDHKQVRVLVWDDGTGVRRGDHERIFDPYVRSDGDRTLPGSLGLGLPVSRRLARIMGGDLTYRNSEGEGSVFELVLPAPVRGHFL